MIGSYQAVADQMQHWFENGACGGFIFQPPYLPGGLDEITQPLVPELQDRGLAPVEYQRDSLRHHMGLARPHSRWEEKSCPLAPAVEKDGRQFTDNSIALKSDCRNWTRLVLLKWLSAQLCARMFKSVI